MLKTKIKLLLGLLLVLAVLLCIPTQGKAGTTTILGKKGFHNGLDSCTCPSVLYKTCGCVHRN